MRNALAILRVVSIGCALLVVFPAFTRAQTQAVPSRITQAVDENNLTTLKGNTHPLARPQFDRGAAPPSLPMERMLLVLKRSTAQESALDTLLDQQQDNSSPNFHQWLTPDQFGQQFGPSDQDIQTITSWLQAHGFQVAKTSRGRTTIEFSGTAGQVQQAFHTAIHQYNVNGEDHWANSSDPQIPSALAPVVAGINTLHNFPRQAMHHVAGVATRSKATGKVTLTQPSLYALGGNCGVPGVGCNAVGPFDFAKIYNILPLWTAATPINGTGQSIAIVGESDINVQDVAAFRTYFGLPAPNVQVTIDGPDPGIVQGDETESDLDVEWAGAVAPNATIDFVVSQSTESSLGVDLSAQYIVDNNVAPILSESYGICELFLGTSGNQFYNQLWQQAAAEGISVLVAAGDSGSAVCDRNAGTQGAAEYGLSVSGISSTPYNVAVGGTDFNDLTNPSTYWSTTNSIPPPPGNQSALPTVSALSYVPETTWNDTCTNSVLATLGYSTNAETNCNNPSLIQYGFDIPVAGSGGKSACTTSDGETVSTCTGGYPKPSWQTGTGVPSDGKRDVPDVSLYAAINSPSGSFYVVCEADFNPGAVSCNPENPNTQFLGVGGTSASAPALAGMLALVNQETQSRQGNANYILYRLATQQPNSFHDVPAGGTIAMPCVTGSTPDCVTNTPGDEYGVLSGYNSAAGYDLATGLGSVNANNLVTEWSAITSGYKGTATTLTLSPAASPIPHGTAVPVTITVAPNPASAGIPTGLVSLITSNGQNAGSLTLGSGGSLAPGTTTSLLPGGSYSVTAHYAGDGTFAPSDSNPPVSVNVSPENSQAQIFLVTFNPTSGQVTNPNATTVSSGAAYLLRVNVSGASGVCAQNSQGESGCPTGTVTITDNGNPVDAGTYTLNSQGYTEVQSVDLPGGTDTLKATYSGDSSYLGSSTTSVVTVTKTAATVSESAPFTKVFLGASNTVNAVISSTGFGPGPTGQVTFSSGATQLGNPVPVTNPMAGSSTSSPQAQATITTSQMPLGSDSITAQYSGDSYYNGATSSPVTVNVQILTSIFIASSNSTINHGSSVTFTATITPSLTTGPGPTGTVVFNDGIGNIGTVTLTNGQAQITTSALPGGNLTITATYSGDANYNSCAVEMGENVNLLATTTTISSSNPAVQRGAGVTFTAQVSPLQSGGAALTGNVSFWSAVTPQGSDTYIGGSVPLVNGQAQITTNSLPANTQLVGASYSGDTNYATSVGTVSQTVFTVGTTTSVTSTNSTISQGSSVTFTATVTPVQSGGLPLTGAVQFLSNGSSIGGPVTVSNGQAQLTTTSLAVGSDQITATYGNDPGYSGSTSPAITEVVNPTPTFSVTANPTAISVGAPGQAGSTVLTFTSQNGLAGTNTTLTATCSGLPSESSCGFSQTSTVASTPITLPANGSTTTTLYVLTTAPSSSLVTPGAPIVAFGRWTVRGVAMLAGALCIVMMLLLGMGTKRIRWSTAVAVLALGLVLVNAACGGGGGSGSGGGGGGTVTNPGTPTTQNAPVSVTITLSGVTQSLPLTLTVQ